MRFSFVVVVAVAAFSCRAPKQPQLSGIDVINYSSQRDVTCTNGAVVSAHPLASKVGVSILKKGGNAIDAAIATQLALAVVYPNAGNIGGGGFLVAKLASGETVSLDYREKAPGLASRDMYLDPAGEPQPLRSTRGTSSSGVPGTVAGLFESLKYARLPFEELIGPAIALAKNGFAISAREASGLNRLQDDLKNYNSRKNVFQRNQPWKEGDMLIQKDLAKTLERIKENGKEGFYEGRTAELIVKEMERSGGYITAADLKNYQAVWRAPHEFRYKEYSIISMPPPSSGGILLDQMLTMVSRFPLKQYGALSADAVQVMTEAERRAFADRALYMGDPDFFKVPVAAITDDQYLEERMKDFVPGVAGNSASVKPGTVPGYESEETTHISIIDKDGNAVAVTTTLNDSYGSRTVVGGAGFLLNDEMDDFSIKPGVPNMYGAVGGDANAIEPAKRMLSAMTPTIVLRNDKPVIVLGTPGGTTIPTSVFQTIIDIVEFGMSPRQAIDLPKFHHQWLPDRIDVEPSFPDSTRTRLQQMGYSIYERGNIGRTEVIKVLDDGSFEAAADMRGDDSAEGY